MESENKIAEPKAIDGIVKFCALCGTEFAESMPANVKITCGGCDGSFTVKKN